MTKVFKGIFHKPTKNTNAWYLKLFKCKYLKDTVRLRAVDNTGTKICEGAILDISPKGYRLHGGLTSKIGLQRDGSRVHEFDF
jgi:hypothetical protein